MLNERGILPIGTGATLEEAWTPKIIEKNGIKIAFISAAYSSVNDDGRSFNEFIARVQHTQKLKTALEEAKKQADYVIASMHA